MGLDKHGRPMHKHLGNVVYPIPIIEKYGADAFRFWAASETKLGYNYQFNENKVEGARKFINKLWNIARFISIFPVINDDEIKLESLELLDKEILIELDEIIKLAREEYSKLDTFYTSNAIRSFTWNTFASNYIELVKSRAYNRDRTFSEHEQKSAWYTLHRVLKSILLILHPISPFVTDYIWRKLYNPKGILKERFPEPTNLILDKRCLKEIINLNSTIWKAKEKRGLPLKSPVKKIVLPSCFKGYIKDIKNLHRIEEIEFSDSVKSLDDLILVI